MNMLRARASSCEVFKKQFNKVLKSVQFRSHEINSTQFASWQSASIFYDSTFVTYHVNQFLGVLLELFWLAPFRVTGQTSFFFQQPQQTKFDLKNNRKQVSPVSSVYNYIPTDSICTFQPYRREHVRKLLKWLVNIFSLCNEQRYMNDEQVDMRQDQLSNNTIECNPSGPKRYFTLTIKPRIPQYILFQQIDFKNTILIKKYIYLSLIHRVLAVVKEIIKYFKCKFVNVQEMERKKL
ncbi:Hypothetical_protein [Hexamita inflata]|uniref:Hypothetical_protein n=1 Tax=Hexamita inflata TaxID=28002 RepID=A0AA86U8M6_9EUKA|nr:Hypothetical protein HINF_LOCUS35250 [Hexamita inflata]